MAVAASGSRPRRAGCSGSSPRAGAPRSVRTRGSRGTGWWSATSSAARCATARRSSTRPRARDVGGSLRRACERGVPRGGRAARLGSCGSASRRSRCSAAATDPECDAAVEATAGLLADLGHELIPLDLPIDRDALVACLPHHRRCVRGHGGHGHREDDGPQAGPGRLRACHLVPPAAQRRALRPRTRAGAGPCRRDHPPARSAVRRPDRHAPVRNRPVPARADRAARPDSRSIDGAASPAHPAGQCRAGPPSCRGAVGGRVR